MTVNFEMDDSDLFCTVVLCRYARLPHLCCQARGYLEACLLQSLPQQKLVAAAAAAAGDWRTPAVDRQVDLTKMQHAAAAAAAVAAAAAAV